MASVTIGLVTHNRPHLLKRAIKSVVDQTFIDWELLISDDNSTEETALLAKEYTASDARIKYVRWDGIGMTKNFIESMKMADSKYFMWLCDDDWLGDNFIEECVQFLEANPDHVACCGTTQFMKDGVVQRANDVLNFEQTLPAERITDYYKKVNSNVILYGLMRLDKIPATIVYPDTFGADLLFSSQIAYLGKIKTLDHVAFYYSEHGISQDQNKLAKYYGLKGRMLANPYNSLRVGVFSLISSGSIVFKNLNKIQRWFLALRCSLIIRERFCMSATEAKIRKSLRIGTRIKQVFR